MEYVLLWNDIIILVCLGALIRALIPGKKKQEKEVEDDDIE